MKYYFKSPAELKESLKNKKRVHPFKNRTFLIIFSDLILIVAIVMILQKTGYIGSRTSYSTDTFARSGIELQGSMNSKFSSTDTLDFFLKATNNLEQPIAFPAESGPYAFTEGRLEIYENGVLYREERLLLNKKSLKPDESVFYKFRIKKELLPNDTSSASFVIILEHKDNPLRLEFPAYAHP